jgi:hypothetical protein
MNALGWIEKEWGQYRDLYRSEYHLLREVVVFEGQQTSFHRHLLRDKYIMIGGAAPLIMPSDFPLTLPNSPMFIPSGKFHKYDHRWGGVNEGNAHIFELHVSRNKYTPIDDNDIEELKG